MKTHFADLIVNVTLAIAVAVVALDMFFWRVIA